MLEPVAAGALDSQLERPEDKPSVTIQQSIRYAVRILTHIGQQTQANLIFDAPSIAKDQQGTRQFSVDIRNTGNQFSRPAVWLDVFDLQGRNIGKFKTEPRSLYVGERKHFQIDIARLAPGKYKGLLAAEDNQCGQIFGSDINLNIQP